MPTDALVAGSHHVAAYALVAGTWGAVGTQPFSVYEIARPELPPHARAVRVQIDDVDVLTPEGALAGRNAPVPANHVALIRGWANDVAAGAPPAGVRARSQAGIVWTAPCDVARPDVVAALGSRSSDRYGFEIAIPAVQLGRGRHVIELTAFDGEGRTFAPSACVDIDVAAPVRPFPAYARSLDEPFDVSAMLSAPGEHPTVLDEHAFVEVSRGTILTLEGWATAPDGTAATDVFVEVASSDRALPPRRHFPIAGVRRDHAPRELREPPLDDAWFWYLLGTADLERGDYRLTFVVVGEGRRTYARRNLGTLTVTKNLSESSAARRAQWATRRRRR